MPAPPAEYVPRQRELHSIDCLAIDEGAFTYLAKLPPLHRDPFDRMLVAQAQQHDLMIATVDVTVQAYPVKLLLP